MEIIFQPEGKKAHASSKDHLLKIADQTGILVDANCSGAGKCGKCKIQVLSGSCNPLTETELNLLSEYELRNQYRLACYTYAYSDLEIMVPQTHAGLNQKKNLMKLPFDFFSENQIHSDERPLPHYGVAFDIGTTTVVGMLWNLLSNELIDVEAKTNYQSVCGSDVISRIQFCNSKPENLSIMQQKIIDCLNDILEEICIRNTINSEFIYEITVVGNTTMSHLFLGVTPKTLSRFPFTPAFGGTQKLPAGDLHLKVCPQANVYLLPNIAGHVGSDILGMILASGLHNKDGCHIAIDIGTNGEIVAIKNGQMITCSTAAGPAFEGATIVQGMRATSGAIEHVEITSDNVIIKTIDNQPAIGICGSGLIDIAAQLLKRKIIDETGNMLTREEALKSGIHPALASRISGSKRDKSFRLTSTDEEAIVSITQQDIRELQLAKGAILAGIQTLMKTLDIQKEQIDSIMIAGAFGNFICVGNALKIGLFPDIPMEKITFIGNAAGTGASMALLSDKMRELASSIATKILHIELSTNMDFQELYIHAMNFK